MTNYHQYLPSPLLSGFVECYWTLRSPGKGADSIQRLIPGGRVELIFNLGDRFHWQFPGMEAQSLACGRIKVMGQRNKISFAWQEGNPHLIGVRFKPGGLAAFSKVPVSEILNQLLPAEYLFGYSVHDCIARLQGSVLDENQIKLLDEFLAKAIRYEPAQWSLVSSTVNFMRTSPDNISIGEICRENQACYKKLERKFLQIVGYTPKNYYRIIRFNRAIREMAFRKNSLTSIGYECGFYDQAHFIKDFRLFTGTTPSLFRKEDHFMADFLIHHQPV